MFTLMKRMTRGGREHFRLVAKLAYMDHSKAQKFRSIRLVLYY